MNQNLNYSLEKILQNYQKSFQEKVFPEDSLEEDYLMLVFGITQQLKAENKQYWGRELGMCWERLIVELCQQTCQDYKEAIKEENDQLCDLIIGKDAIDTKYRIGSGDSGTLKKFKNYGKRLQDLGYNPILLILRNDNLAHAIKACEKAGWIIKTGDQAYNYINQITNFNLKQWLKNKSNSFKVE